MAIVSIIVATDSSIAMALILLHKCVMTETPLTLTGALQTAQKYNKVSNA